MGTMTSKQWQKSLIALPKASRLEKQRVKGRKCANKECTQRLISLTKRDQPKFCTRCQMKIKPLRKIKEEDKRLLDLLK